MFGQHVRQVVHDASKIILTDGLAYLLFCRHVDALITNTGTTNAYIRARIVGSWVDDESGLVVRKWEPDNDGTFAGFPGEGWKENGDYYYYTTPVTPGETTSALFTSYTVTVTVDGAHLEMDILMQTIQSEGGNSNGNAAKAAWGVDPSTLE